MWPLFYQLKKILPLKILIDIEYGKFMFKSQNELLPELFDSYFWKPPHRHRTRYAKNNLEKLRITTVKEESLLKYIHRNNWADIPLFIKNSASLKVFIKSFRTHLIGNFKESDC